MDPQFQNLQPQGDNFTMREKHAHRHDMAQRIIELLSAVLIGLLGFRFVFALLGANPANGLTTFVYGATSPFTAPFYNLFNYDHPSIGSISFEGYTLIAMAVYGLLSYALVRALAITRY